MLQTTYQLGNFRNAEHLDQIRKFVIVIEEPGSFSFIARRSSFLYYHNVSRYLPKSRH